MKFIINLLILFVLIINSSYADDELITLEELRSLDSKIDNIEVSEIYKDILEVYSLNNLQGYAFLTSSFSDALGFSSAEFNILIYLSKNGEILAAKLLSHSEPLFLYDKGEKSFTPNVLFSFSARANFLTVVLGIKFDAFKISGIKAKDKSALRRFSKSTVDIPWRPKTFFA